MVKTVYTPSEGNATHSMDEIKVANDSAPCYTPATLAKGATTEYKSIARDFVLITKDKVQKALKDMKRGNAPGVDDITADLLKEGEDIVLKNLPDFSRNA